MTGDDMDSFGTFANTDESISDAVAELVSTANSAQRASPIDAVIRSLHIAEVAFHEVGELQYERPEIFERAEGRYLRGWRELTFYAPQTLLELARKIDVLFDGDGTLGDDSAAQLVADVRRLLRTEHAKNPYPGPISRGDWFPEHDARAASDTIND